jgi:hypothetical protein
LHEFCGEQLLGGNGEGQGAHGEQELFGTHGLHGDGGQGLIGGQGWQGLLGGQGCCEGQGGGIGFLFSPPTF